jgi:hypothetical protein
MANKVEKMESIQQEIEAAKKAGFTNQEIKDSYADEINAAKSAGFNDEEINKTYGLIEREDPVLKEYVSKITKEYLSQEIVSPDDELLYQSNLIRGKPVKKALTDIKESVVGENFDGDIILNNILGKNLYNITKRAALGQGTPDAYKLPNPKDYTWTEEFLETVGTLGLELPLYAVSALAGSPGGVIGSAFTAAAIPTTTRATLLKVLENQDEKKPSDIMEILLKETLWEGTKEGLKFSASAVLPLLKIPVVGPAAQNFFTNTAAQIIGYQGTGLLLNEEIPTKEEFATTGALFTLMNIILPNKFAQKKSKEIFVKTGDKPTDITLKASKDRTMREDLNSSNIIVPRTYAKKIIELKEGKDFVEISSKPTSEPLNFLNDPIATKAAENMSFNAPKIDLSLKSIQEGIKETAKTSKRKFIIEVIDQKYPVLEALREAKVNTKTGIEKLNIYEALRIMEGMQGRSGYFIEYGTLDFKTLAENGKSLMKIVEPMALLKNSKDELRLFSTYLTNKRAIELSERGIETGIDIPNAKIFVNKYSKRQPNKKDKQTYKNIEKEIYIYQDKLLQYAVDGGLITKEAAEAMRSLNKNYVTLARQLPKVGEKGFNGSANPFKRIKGSKTEIIDPLESIVKNTDMIVRMTELNKVKVDFINFVEKMKATDPKIFDYITKKKGDLQPIKIQRKELEKFYDKKEIDKISDKGIEELTIFRQEAVRPDEVSFGIRRNGKYEVWEVGSDLVTAFRVMDNPALNLWQKWMSAPSRTLRTGAIVTPNFLLPNFFRDTLQATFLSKIGWLPIADSMYGLFFLVFKGNVKKANEAYKRYMKGGGMQSTLTSIDRSLFDSQVHSILSKGVMRNEHKGVLGPIHYLTNLSEQMTRIGINEKVYQKAKKLGLTEREAIERGGFESRDLLDYAKKGTLGAMINRYSTFWNARVQGMDKLVNSAKDRPQKFMAMIGAVIVLPTIALNIVNEDNEKYKELPEYIKQSKWFVDTGDKEFFAPKPFEAGTFFSAITDLTLNWIRSDDKSKEAFSEFSKDFLLNNVKAFNPLPTWSKPIIENLMDYSFFKGSPILPKDAPENMKNKYYSTEQTNETIKLFADKLSSIIGDESNLTNPVWIENVYDGWFGDIGRMVKKFTDYLLINAGVIDDPIKPEDPITKIPGLRAFDVKDVYGYSKSVKKYYDKTEKYRELFNTTDYLLQTGNNEAYLKEQAKVNFDLKAVIEIDNEMRNIVKNIKIITNAKYKDDGTLFTSEEKRDIIDDLYMTRIGLAQKALQIIKNVEQGNK